MAYVEPATVVAPRTSVRSVDVLYNTKSGGWSVARLNWEGEERLGIRWNGTEGPGVGNPQSRAVPTWFVLPDELTAVVLQRVEELSLAQQGGLVEGYREMARDTDRESEAHAWSEGLISDAADQER
jgi:hypothetical protein